MPRKPKPSKYARIGDKVRVTRPRGFIRCGYPLDHNEVRIQYAEEVTRLADAAGLAMGVTTYRAKTRDWLERAACSVILERLNFGGKQRRIFEYDDDDPRCFPPNVDCEVMGKKFVVTGDYKSGYSYRYDHYESPELTNMKVHCVYEIMRPGGKWPNWILASNCQVSQLGPASLASQPGSLLRSKVGVDREREKVERVDGKVGRVEDETIDIVLIPGILTT